MKAAKIIRVSAIIMAALAVSAPAQTNFVTLTNFVTITVTVTNFVTATNPASSGPAPVAFTAPFVPAPDKKAKHPWNNSVSAGLTLARGNTDTTLVSADYQTVKKTPENEYSAAAGVAYGEQNSKQTVDNYKASFQWNHLITDRLYDYLRVDGLRDYIADVDYRLTVGPGAGYYLIKQTNTLFSVEGGANYEAQELGGNGNTFATVRLADKFEYKINNHARAWQTFEIFPQVDRWDNFVVNFEIGAEAAFSKSLSLKTCLDDNYNNRPAVAHEKNDVKLVAGVAYKF